MAWEWVSPITGAVVAIAGIAAGVWTTRGGQEHNRQLAGEQRDADSRESHRRWLRERRAEAYVNLLNVAEGVGEYVALVFPLMDTDDAAALPPLPDRDTQRSTRAAGAAFGSEEVLSLTDAWGALARAALREAENIARGDDEARMRLHELRSKEQEARGALSRAISRELADLSDRG